MSIVVEKLGIKEIDHLDHGWLVVTWNCGPSGEKEFLLATRTVFGSDKDAEKYIAEWKTINSSREYFTVKI